MNRIGVLGEIPQFGTNSNQVLLLYCDMFRLTVFSLHLWFLTSDVSLLPADDREDHERLRTSLEGRHALARDRYLAQQSQRKAKIRQSAYVTD